LGGGTLGAVLGWLLAGGTALIPGVGPVVAAGIFGATVTGALVGGALGSIATALVGQGIPEEEAAEYEEHVRGGRTLLTVRAANGQMLGSALDIFDRNNASGVRYYNQGETGPGKVYSRGEMSDTSLNDSAANRVSADENVTDSGWTGATTNEVGNVPVSRIENSADHPTSLDESNATNLDDRDYGIQHTTGPTPEYHDETYRSRDRATVDQTRTGVGEGGAEGNYRTPSGFSNESGLGGGGNFSSREVGDNRTDRVPGDVAETGSSAGSYNEPRYGKESDAIGTNVPVRDRELSGDIPDTQDLPHRTTDR
jgi:hypothetical protein